MHVFINNQIQCSDFECFALSIMTRNYLVSLEVWRLTSSLKILGLAHSKNHFSTPGIEHQILVVLLSIFDLIFFPVPL